MDDDLEKIADDLGEVEDLGELLPSITRVQTDPREMQRLRRTVERVLLSEDGREIIETSVRRQIVEVVRKAVTGDRVRDIISQEIAAILAGNRV